jgi:hypothetical protein
MESKLIFVITIFLAVSGCQSIKKTDGFALVVTPVELQIASEDGEDAENDQGYN